eukprot:SAG31_NODE_27009_length_432_cov_1.327327_1_plen_20_part_10
MTSLRPHTNEDIVGEKEQEE